MWRMRGLGCSEPGLAFKVAPLKCALCSVSAWICEGTPSAFNAELIDSPVPTGTSTARSRTTCLRRPRTWGSRCGWTWAPAGGRRSDTSTSTATASTGSSSTTPPTSAQARVLQD